MEIEIRPPNNLIQIIKVIWLSFLLYVIIGGSLGFLVQLLGYVGSFCSDPSDLSGTYRTCESCELYFSVFSVIGLYDCENAFVEIFSTVLIIIPRSILVVIGILVYPMIELLDILSRGFTIAFFVLLTIFAFSWTVYKHLYKQKNMFRGIHRASLFTLFLLGGCIAIGF